MPIDPMMLDATLNTFRTMAQEIKDKGIQDESVDEMQTALSRMEELGSSLDDFNDFNASMMNENLYMRFSDHYGKALAAESVAAQQSSVGGGYDDAALLNQNLQALRDAVTRLKQGKEDAIAEAKKQPSQEMADSILKTFTEHSPSEELQLEETQGFTKEIEVLIEDKALTDPIEEVIALGEQEGMTFPRFLRLQIEQGLDKAMEGTVVAKKGIEYQLGWAKANATSKWHIEEVQAELDGFDQLCRNSEFNAPDGKLWSLERQGIERKFQPDKLLWEAIKTRWEDIIDTLEMWVIAHSKYYGSYAPWKFMPRHEDKVSYAEYVKACHPGILKEKLRIFKEYFGLRFEDIFTHETFRWEVKVYHLGFSQEFINYLKNDLFTECVPGASASSQSIERFEQMYESNLIRNPEAFKALERVRDFYDSMFGKGRYEEMFEAVPEPNGSAAPWQL